MRYDGVGVFSDPGSVPCDAIPLSSADSEESLGMCVKCNVYKPPRAHHCSECKRCIVRMDHHCPYVGWMSQNCDFSLKWVIGRWINNCVGIANTKFFILFTFYTFLFCLLNLVIVACFFIFRDPMDNGDVVMTLCLLGAIIMLLAIFFIMFTAAMLCDSLGMVRTGTTGRW